MTLDALSDLVLALVCVWIAVRSFKTQQAGLGVSALLIGLAALLGVVRFSAWGEAAQAVRGAHQFCSLLAAVGAFPLLAYSLLQSASPISTRLAGAWWVTFVFGGFGVAVVVFGFKLWAQIVPAVSALFIGVAILTKQTGLAKQTSLLGFVCLLASFAAHLFLQPGDLVFNVLSKVQLLHYFLALALLLLTHQTLALSAVPTDRAA